MNKENYLASMPTPESFELYVKLHKLVVESDHSSYSVQYLTDENIWHVKIYSRDLTQCFETSRQQATKALKGAIDFLTSKWYKVCLAELDVPTESGRVVNRDSFSGLLDRFKKQGQIAGEFGHPKPRNLLHRNEDYLARCMEIRLDNACCFFKNPIFVKGSDSITRLIVEVLPFGPHKEFISKQIEEAGGLRVFGLRGLTTSKEFLSHNNGVDIITTVVTWDFLGLGNVVSYVKEQKEPHLTEQSPHSEKVKVVAEMLKLIDEDAFFARNAYSGYSLDDVDPDPTIFNEANTRMVMLVNLREAIKEAFFNAPAVDQNPHSSIVREDAIIELEEAGFTVKVYDTMFSEPPRRFLDIESKTGHFATTVPVNF